jgi:hypothetical protein
MSEKPKIVDTEGLSDADWAEINKRSLGTKWQNKAWPKKTYETYLKT